MLSDDEGIGLNISRSGQPVYCFVSSQGKLNGSARLERLADGKGFGTVANTVIPQSAAVYSEQSAAICIVGDNDLHICKHCYVKIAQKAKARDDYPRITFCSNDCLQQAEPYLDFCAPFLHEIQTTESLKDVSHILKLAVQYVFSVSVAGSANALAHLLQILDLESHPESAAERYVLNTSSKWLYSRFAARLTEPTLQALTSRGIPLKDKILGGQVLYKLCRIIKFNAQSVPVHGVPKAQLMCLVYSVARINHSCAPNCALVYDVYNTTTTTDADTVDKTSTYSVKVSVLALRDIPPNEELTMSYMQPLCSSADLRQTLLQQGFLFNCRCARCVAPPLPAELTAQCTHLETQLNSAAQSGKATSYVVLSELVSAAELVLQQFGAVDVSIRPALPVCAVHDAASFVLQHCTQALKSSTTSTGAAMDASQQGNVVQLIVRANLTLCRCWSLAGCAQLLQRVETAISGSNYAVQLQKLAQVLKVKYMHVGAYKSELGRVLEMMRSAYGCGKSGGSASNSGDSGVLVPRDTSTLPYIHKLYQKGLENYQLLK